MGRGSGQTEAQTCVLRGQETHTPAGFVELSERLLALGGRRLVVPRGEAEEHMDALLARGEHHSGQDAEQRLGDTSQCHANSAALWEQGAGDICTGYALSDDGLWRQHTWVIAPGGTLIETTELREGYFGVRLSDEQAEEFAFENW